MLFGQPKCWYFRHQPWVSQKLKFHEKDIHKFGKVPSLSTHVRKIDGKFSMDWFSRENIQENPTCNGKIIGFR